MPSLYSRQMNDGVGMNLYKVAGIHSPSPSLETLTESE